ncbi:polymer-forming cytoskeletal protein [Paracoccus aurantiacus]|uniref:Polymer-forming cytoskeletal protein n=1 Tax=Paracoccus aurantiacus TaxID=2599412 RepID=A0A5C6S9Y2_9RHOB|nr:polymer-forming cytoskeletal protein [Paracoccus aurantiacus]TXB71266.1 polymer-forming cytoskeletal protein [Paracoccus aurantiacus]
MFSKSRVTETPNQQPKSPAPESEPVRSEAPVESAATPAAPQPQRQRSAPSVLSSDLTIKGDLQTAGDVQIEGNIEGDIRARQLTIGDTATVRGEVLADEVIVNGRVVGRLRGLKVRLSSTARVEGDIIHKTIAIESGAHFEGSVQRQDDPLAQGGTKKLAPPATDFGKSDN